MKQILLSIRSTSRRYVQADRNRFTGQMDESDWNQVLRNCSLLYGWKIDKKANKVVRATTPGKSMFGK